VKKGKKKIKPTTKKVNNTTLVIRHSVTIKSTQHSKHLDWLSMFFCICSCRVCFNLCLGNWTSLLFSNKLKNYIPIKFPWKHMNNNYRLAFLYKLRKFWILNVGILCFLVKGSKKFVVHFELTFWFMTLLDLDNTLFVEPYLIFNSIWLKVFM